MLQLPSMALLTDLYQLTMAQGYWKSGLHSRPAVFDLFYRENPFKGGDAIASGLEAVVSLIEGYCFRAEDIGYLARLQAFDGSVLYQFKRRTPELRHLEPSLHYPVK